MLTVPLSRLAVARSAPSGEMSMRLFELPACTACAIEKSTAPNRTTRKITFIECLLRSRSGMTRTVNPLEFRLQPAPFGPHGEGTHLHDEGRQRMQADD